MRGRGALRALVQALLSPLLPVKRERTYTERTLVLDHQRFNHCTFLRCTLIYRGGPLYLTNNSLQSCRYHFAGKAAGALVMLKWLSETPAGRQVLLETFPKFAAYVGEEPQ